jgi:chemotaxis signal transduction protein
MKDYIVFTVGSNYYALDVECVERIIQTPPITMIPNVHPVIDGMISYENKVVKVLDFRKMTGMSSYQNELRDLFKHAKDEYLYWVKKLKESVEGNSTFPLSLNMHESRFGQWLDSYTTHDEEILAILKNLRPLHAKLYETGKEILLLRERDLQTALKAADQSLDKILSIVLEEIEKMGAFSEMIAQRIQKLLIYQEKENFFAIKVDTIEDIVNIEPSMVKGVDSSTRHLYSLVTEGVVEIGDRLVNVIKSVTLPTRGGV